MSDVIRPGELVTIHQAFLLEQVPLQNAFALDNCGGFWSAACENAYQLAAVENLLMVGTVTGIGGLTVGAVRTLVARASAACGRDPRCWVGFLGREVGEEALSEVAAGGAMVTGIVTLADEIASAVRVSTVVTNPPILTISDAQWGRKMAQHMGDFGMNVADSTQRNEFRIMVETIGSNPDRVVSGTFSGGDVNGRRDVLFFIRGNDVVVTSPVGEFVTILQNGITNGNVVRALNGG
ncbi:MAG: hypothetical protein LPK02_14710 [Rhodobacterales bacterium]|nr:hypothetical protein [Rhodobacterales bacterium]